ncbi:DUF819 family protein [Candidatus Cryosericum septentrionale]|jgi:uncharacterized membrane protein|uniref:DUF819 family protein n=1 Tax=Candidatus Cryosericum septentrionale TaxID=2290913 RepID=A0A398DNN8_9BACT|nr:DUF819 family protein [Candidatus Cryosericum septentrionale]RIE17232.1 DUF819 family protein [Candidatus Cryosericum septentrionale]
MVIVFCVVAVIFPALLVYLCYRFAALRKIGTVLLCYAAGIILGNIGLLPKSVAPLQSTVTNLSVALALPLLLFSIDVKKWFKVAGKGMLCMLLATIAIVAVAFAAYLVTRKGDTEAWQLAGMAMGMYTGGTPNMAAIKSALGVPSSTYILFLTYDTVVSLVYILLMSSVARPFFRLYLKPFESPLSDGAVTAEGDEDESIEAYSGMFKPANVRGLGLALLLSAAIVGVSVFLGGLLPGSASTAVTILSITTLGISASFVPAIRKIRKTFQAGMYVIYVFCFVVASMAKLDSLIHIDFRILGFVIACIFGSLLLHSLLCRLFKIDVDTFIITSVSAVCSPPFVPGVAAALKNKAIIISGLTTGIVGYAIGNYLGIFFAYLFRSIP